MGAELRMETTLTDQFVQHEMQKTRCKIRTMHSRWSKFLLALVFLVLYFTNSIVVYDRSLSKPIYLHAFTSLIPLRVMSNKNSFVSNIRLIHDSCVTLRHSSKNHNEDPVADDDDINTEVGIDISDKSSTSDSIGIARISNIDPILVYADIFAILIACQLLGLLDVLHDATFWRNGGWFQRITIISTESSSTLPIFLQRVASNTVCYICCTFVLINGCYECDTALRSPNSIFNIMISSIVTFTIARIATAFISFLLVTHPISIDECNVFITNRSDQVIELLRESYFIAITTTSARFGLYKFNT